MSVKTAANPEAPAEKLLERGDDGLKPDAARAHIPALDGLRGVAILMVLFGHFYRKAFLDDHYTTAAIVGRIFGAGAMGVELFFVLSGFLITGILLDKQGRPGAFRDFYIRRSLRIFPLYFLSLAVILFVLPHFVAFDEGANRVAGQQLWLWTYTINWPGLPWVYDDSQLFLLGHFWSLCVEEHFYLLWPPLAFLRSRKQLLFCATLLLAVGIGSRTLSHFLGGGAPILAQWPTLQKVDGLAVGAILAILVRNPRWAAALPTGKRFRRSFVVAAVLLIAILWGPKSWHASILTVPLESIAAITFGFMLLWAYRLKPGEKGYRLLCGPVLTSFGKYSYGIYVIHGIMRPTFERFFDSWLQPLVRIPWIYMLVYIVAATGISYLLAFASFHLMEKRFLSLKRYFNYGQRAAKTQS